MRTLPVAGGLILGGLLSAKLAERLGLRAVVPAGLAIVAGALALLTLADAGTGYGIVAAVAIDLTTGPFIYRVLIAGGDITRIGDPAEVSPPC